MTEKIPRVAIVGRPNVGKSSIFNRVLGQRRAIVENEPGTTRDRLEADVEWLDRRFRLVDTGGYETREENVFAAPIVEQIRIAIMEAAVIVLVLDARDGLTASDYDIADVVRRANKPTIIVANKADNDTREAQGAAEAGALGFGEPVPVSAIHGVNIGWMLDEVIASLPSDIVVEEADRVRVAIIGRPNVGKSMLVNALLGEERVIVSDVAGTTRDAIDSELDTPEGRFLLVDTAGVRRRGKLGTGIELHSVLRTRAAVERADVAVLVIDGNEGLTAQDTHIAGIALDALRGLIIAVNKVDLWDDPENQHNWSQHQLHSRLSFAPWALVVFVSALERNGMAQLLDLSVTIAEARRRRVTTPDLNALLSRALREHMPPLVQSKRFKLFYATQAGINPPEFVFFVNDPEILHFSYKRYLERRIRDAYDFEGTPIKLTFRGRTSQEEAQ